MTHRGSPFFQLHQWPSLPLFKLKHTAFCEAAGTLLTLSRCALCHSATSTAERPVRKARTLAFLAKKRCVWRREQAIPSQEASKTQVNPLRRRSARSIQKRHTTNVNLINMASKKNWAESREEGKAFFGGRPSGPAHHPVGDRTTGGFKVCPGFKSGVQVWGTCFSSARQSPRLARWSVVRVGKARQSSRGGSA